MKLLYTLVCAASLLLAQAPAGNKTLTVEHAVPFGTVPGKLMLLGNYLVFVDEGQPESSYVVPRGGIETLTAEGPTITVVTKETVRNRSGETRRLSFRVAPGGDPAPATGWFAMTTSGSSMPAAGAATSATKAGEAGPYQARHDHRFGSCSGRLLVTDQMVSYESVDEVKHSRRWEYKSIKEVKLPNPYEIEIKAFEGDSYNLKLDGSGMDPAAFKQLVDRVTAARSGR